MEDNFAMVIGLAAGVPLGVISVVALILMAIHIRRMSKEKR